MRILLINPYYPISETPSPPLGLSYLAGALEQNDIEVKILDLVVYPYDKPILENILNEFQPQVVGATSVTMNYYDACRVIRDTKAICPDIVTVMGGAHVTFCPEETLKELPELDMVALGEGENTIVSIVKEAAGARNWNNIEGIVFRDGTSTFRTPKKAGPIPADHLPLPARRLLPLRRYRALGMPITMTTSRGCPYHCIFCVGRKLLGSKVRFRAPEAVAYELEEISTLKFHQLNIADDLFTGNKRHCFAICDQIINRNLNISWTAFARVDTVSYDLLEKMKMAGCHTISFGVESANKNILRTVKKGITPEQVISAVRICNDIGISPHASFILGLPGETPETLKETIRFGEILKDMGVAFGFHLLAPFPGTEVREKAAELGIKILTNDWRHYHANKPITETTSVTKQMLDTIVKEWDAEFQDWLSQIGQRIKQGTASEQEKREYEKLEHAAVIYDLLMDSTLEKLGKWTRKTGALSAEVLLKDLAQRINGTNKHSTETIYRTLVRAHHRQEIIFHFQADEIRCTWAD